MWELCVHHEKGYISAYAETEAIALQGARDTIRGELVQVKTYTGRIKHWYVPTEKLIAIEVTNIEDESEAS